jgi:hypothetical protein
MFTYELKYGDGAIEHNAKAEWVTFDMRPNFEPEVRQRTSMSSRSLLDPRRCGCPCVCRCPCAALSSLSLCRYRCSSLPCQDGLYDEKFLTAPKPSLGAALVQDFMRKIQDRRFEGLAADNIQKLVNPDVPGRKPGEPRTMVAFRSVLPCCRLAMPASRAACEGGGRACGCVWEVGASLLLVLCAAGASPV